MYLKVCWSCDLKPFFGTQCNRRLVAVVVVAVVVAVDVVVVVVVIDVIITVGIFVIAANMVIAIADRVVVTVFNVPFVFVVFLWDKNRLHELL